MPLHHLPSPAPLPLPLLPPPQVRFVCSGASAGGESTITSIKEPASCSYVLTIATPRLCKHPEFRSAPPPVAAIRCIPHASAAADGTAAVHAPNGGASRTAAALPAGAGDGECAAEGSCGVSAASEAAGAETAAATAAEGAAAEGLDAGGSGGAAGQPGVPEAAEQPAAAAANATVPPPYGYEGEEWDDPYSPYEGLVDGAKVDAMEGGGLEPEVLDEMFSVAMQEIARDEDGGEGGDEGEGYDEEGEELEEAAGSRARDEL